MAIVLFLAAIAVAKEYPASQKINQIVVKGHLEQTVIAGENIETIQILYENTGFAENYDPEYKEGSTKLTDNFGLTKRWTKGPICEISGQMRDDIVAGTYNAYIVVKDNEGNYAMTQLTFIVNEKPFSLEWDKSSGSVEQTVNAGDAIDTILFDYEGMKRWGVGGLPPGVTKDIDETNHKIIIAGTVNKDIMSGDYGYTVIVQNNLGEEISETGKISVTGGQAVTSIEVEENENQKVVAGNEIKPVVFLFKNVRVDENLSAFKTDEGTLKGKFKYSVEGDKLTVSGTVDENMQDGSYSIKIIVKGENNCDTAFASVEVSHKPVVTKITVIKNESQKVTAGDSIKPIVFYKEHALELVLPNFPGGYERMENNDTVTIIGLIQEGSKGLHDIVLSVIGPENQATAKATIEVIPATMTFDLVEGSDNQTAAAGQDITPIVYQYSHMYSVKGTLPANLKLEKDKEKKQVKISGTVDPESATYEYTYTLELTDYYENTKTVTGKINVVASIDDIPSSSSEETVSSSSKETSSSSETTKPTSSSSEKTTSSSSTKSSSSEKIVSSSSEETVSSSSKETSSSSETTKPTSSSSEKSKSSSSTAKSSSSSKKGKSSSSEKSSIIASVVPSFEFGFVNNELTVVLPKPAMLRVQVFDMMGHTVETFAESVSASKNFNLAHLNKGNYVVRIESERYARTAKILVK